MKERWDRIKNAARRHGPTIVVTATASIISTAMYIQRNKQWQVWVIDKEWRDRWDENPDACVTFKDEKLIFTGQEWNPDK